MAEFQQRARASLQELGLVAEDFTHTTTGARHVHVRSESPLWAFVVAFQTPCENNTGCAHILEHLCLSGGQTYPVRGSFFHSRRRSLSTAMNAFTEADCTAFHFATTNARDFENLCNVFLDATLTPLLHPLDFAQEAYRLEPTANGGVHPTGVVFNEMRGALSAASAQLALALRAALFPSTPYRYNEGGFPHDIARLSHAQLKAFHSRYYRSTNCTVVTHAPRSSEFIQRTLIPWLCRTENDANAAAATVSASSLHEPQFPRPVSQNQSWYSTAGNTAAAIGWVFGKRQSIDDVLEAALLRDILLRDEGSPLARALQRCGFTQELLPAHEVAPTAANLSFVVGFSDCGEDAIEKLEQATECAFQSLQRHPIADARIRAALLALEVRTRHGNTERHPRDLGRLIDALPLLLHGCDLADALDHVSALTRLRKRATDNHFVAALVERRLMDNPHRACIALHGQRSDHPPFDEPPSAQEMTQAAALQKALTERQAADNPIHLLPRMSLKDVTSIAESHKVDKPKATGNVPCTHYVGASAGLVTIGIAIDISGLDESLTGSLAPFCDLLMESPLRGKGVAQTHAERANVSQQFSLEICPGAASLHDTKKDLPFASLFFSAIALSENASQLTQMLIDTLENCDFADVSLLTHQQSRAHAARKQRLAGQGHLMAMHAARAHYSHAARLLHYTVGVAPLLKVSSEHTIADDGNAKPLSERLSAISAYLRHAPRRLMTVCDDSFGKDLRINLATHTQSSRPAQAIQPALRTPLAAQSLPLALCTETTVNYCAATFPGVSIEHPDGPALAVLGPLLTELRLHPHLRERHGAYGSGAELHVQTASFALFSYRDPRLAETLNDLKHVGDWLSGHPLSGQDIEDAILGVLRVLDRRVSTFHDARAHFLATLGGHGAHARKHFRDRVLNVNESQIRSTADRYLAPQHASIAVITNEAALAAASGFAFAAQRF